MKFPFIPYKHIAIESDNLLLEYYGKIDETIYPIDIEGIIFDYLYTKDGLWLDKDRELGCSDKLDKVIGKTDFNNAKIYICKSLILDKTKGRYNFTVAHELGHWRLHRALFEQEKHQLKLFRNTNSQMVSLERNVLSSNGKIPDEERQANYFAISLLVNDNILNSEWRKRFGDNKCLSNLVELHNYARDIAREEVDGLPSLVNFFGTSVEAMANKLKDSNYVCVG